MALWRATRQCRNSLCHQILPTAVMQPSLHSSHRSASSCEGCSRWSEGELTKVRRKFWSLVRSLIHQCVLCRRFKGAPFRAPPPPPLPDILCKKNHRSHTLGSISRVHSTYIHLIAPAQKKCGYVFSLALSQCQFTWTSSPTCPLRSSSDAETVCCKEGNPSKTSV